MREEISIYFRERSFRKRILLAFALVIFFVIANGVAIYTFNSNNYYFYAVKKIIPYPALVIGKNIVTINNYESEVSLNKKIYESAYQIDFSSTEEGKRNLEELRKNVKDDILDRLIMEEYLKEAGKDVSKKDVKDEYEKIVRDVGSDKEIRDILRYASNINTEDIKSKIYLNILKERTKENVLYSLKIKIVSLKPDDANSEDGWNKIKDEADSAVKDIRESPENFDKYYLLYNKDNDAVVNNFSGRYVLAEDLPEGFEQSFYSLGIREISDPLKTESGYYIIMATEKRGYYRGSLEEFLEEQKNKLRVWSFIH